MKQKILNVIVLVIGLIGIVLFFPVLASSASTGSFPLETSELFKVTLGFGLSAIACSYFMFVDYRDIFSAIFGLAFGISGAYMTVSSFYI